MGEKQVCNLCAMQPPIVNNQCVEERRLLEFIRAPEEDDESVDLDDHADDGVAQEDDEDAAEEGRRSLGLVPLEEEPEGPLEADDEREAADEQDLEETEEPF